ncbi:hypothetical protein F4803DRAFT_573837 [Xylaria telfairii]|nr:hypothetical protein F4803DRAFT_573837 [Xylaria telfairii]
MSKNANKKNNNKRENKKNENDKFWNVFVDRVPRVPSVDELICRVVGVHFPQGIVTDINGARIDPPRDARVVTKQILDTIKSAIELEQDFWSKQLRQKGFVTPYTWGVKLSANIAITEAENMINEALEYVGNIDQLNTLFWDAYRRTEVLCARDNRQLEWPPFKRK